MDKKSKSTKKNTLLYLDENLVELAKEMNFNISELAEEAIKTKLNINGYNKRFDPSKYLENLRKKGLAYRIPFKISKIKIDNHRFLKKIDIDFEQNNMMVGGTASGKTTIVRSILLFFDNSHSLKDFSYEDYLGGPEEIKITFNQIDKLTCEVYGERINLNGGCILIDEGLERLDHDASVVFLKYLLDRKEQIIITSLSSDGYSYEPWIKNFKMIEIQNDPSEDLHIMERQLIHEMMKREKQLEMLRAKFELKEQRLKESEAGGLKEEEIKSIKEQIMSIEDEIKMIQFNIKKNRNNLDEVRNQIVSRMHEDE
ncbi:MAG: ATP-binding protein [Candidatus Methanofastidiosum sp.]|nr:ATP-binding protein [Methanofastidiosum sp.]